MCSMLGLFLVMLMVSEWIHNYAKMFGLFTGLDPYVVGGSIQWYVRMYQFCIHS